VSAQPTTGIVGTREELVPLGDDTLLFIHLPKTGGTALRNALKDAFEPARSAFVYGAGDLDESISRAAFEALSADELDRLRLVMGHFRYGIHQQIRRPYRYATLVRQPVDRVVSLYYHYLNLPGVRFLSRNYRERWRLRLRRVSLEDWVFGERRVTADNLMVRNVAGVVDVPFGGCTQGLFEQAMENVERDFAAVLVAEAMPQSLALLERVLSEPLPPLGRENVNPRRPRLSEVDAAVADAIVELNQWDVRFYDAARRRLEDLQAEAR
jgi:hypothetical protein